MNGEHTLIERINGMSKMPHPWERRGAHGSAGFSPQEPARLVASPFDLVEAPPESSPPGPGGSSDQPPGTGGLLSEEEVEHLEFCARHGMPVHRMEVETLLERHAATGDVEALRRSIAILQHKVSLLTSHSSSLTNQEVSP